MLYAGFSGRVYPKKALTYIFRDFFPKGFFNGIGQYYKVDDESFGKELFCRTLKFLKKEFEDKESFYSLGIFEEYIVAKIIRYFMRHISVFNLGEERGKAKEKVEETLQRKYNLSYPAAFNLSKELTIIHNLELGDREENIIFYDDDYSFFFEEGFVEGLLRVKSFAGEMAGYGYESAEEIFTAVGIDPPTLLLGSKEANKIANEMSAANWQEKFFL